MAKTVVLAGSPLLFAALAANGTQTKQTRAVAVYENIKASMEAHITGLKNEIRRTKIAIDETVDFGGESSLSTRPTSPNFDAEKWVKTRTALVVQLNNQLRELAILEKDAASLFTGTMPAEDLAADDVADPSLPTV